MYIMKSIIEAMNNGTQVKFRGDFNKYESSCYKEEFNFDNLTIKSINSNMSLDLCDGGSILFGVDISDVEITEVPKGWLDLTLTEIVAEYGENEPLDSENIILSGLNTHFFTFNGDNLIKTKVILNHKI